MTTRVVKLKLNVPETIEDDVLAGYISEAVACWRKGMDFSEPETQALCAIEEKELKISGVIYKD